MTFETPYQRWMAGEGIPVVPGYGVADAREVPRGPWARTGGRGALLDLRGFEGFTGTYVCEIPPGGALHPQKHLYQQLICVLEGKGAAEVWLPGDEAHKTTFEWQRHSLFATPLNCWYRLYNGGREPAIFLAVTDAPLWMDLVHNEAFVFENDFRFTDRFHPTSDYFSGEHRYDEASGAVWETNLISDVSQALVDPQERKGAGVRITRFEMAGSSLAGHLAEWPVGRYHKAHHHQGGAVLLILRSVGYSLMWPLEAGAQPYRSGRGDQVVRVDWQEGAVFSPPSKWFHQHFNTGTEPARQLALRFGSGNHPTGFHLASYGVINGQVGVYVSQREGGTLIEYEDEDPRIRQDYAAALPGNVSFDMPPIQGSTVV